jgi:hypothetical protein
MAEVKLILVEDGYPEKPGEASVYTYNVNGKTLLGLVWCCPQCGKPATSVDKKDKDGNFIGKAHSYNPETKTLSPSIVHDKKLGGCGYHGWLRNGIFKPV